MISRGQTIPRGLTRRYVVKRELLQLGEADDESLLNALQRRGYYHFKTSRHLGRWIRDNLKGEIRVHREGKHNVYSVRG